MSMYNHSECVDRLKILRESVNFEIKKERLEFLRHLHPVIADWKGQIPNLLDIFKPEEIECLLSDSIKLVQHLTFDKFVSFVARSGYEDKPKLDTDGKPILLRTTPVHHAARFGYDPIVKELFTVYNRFDLNYTDESGLTHFHAACECRFKDVVEKFLELGQDPNCLAQKSVNPPLHTALEQGNGEMAKLLLKAGADPNLANEDGLTPLHFIVKASELNDYSSVKMLFKLRHDRYKPVQVNARDKRGRTPLHYAVTMNLRFNMIRWLLDKGANPNLADIEGLTPLHIICKTISSRRATDVFFEICEEHQPLEIDARDKLGRTPLQWAVASFEQDMVKTLFNKGADLSSFVFPTESHFDEFFEAHYYYYSPFEWKWRSFTLEQLSKLTNIVKFLEDKGYEFDEKDILTKMKIFSKHRLFKETPDLDELLRSSIIYVDWAKKLMLSSGLSLYELMQLSTEEAKKLFTIKDYLNVKRTPVWGKLDEKLRQACILHLCEILFRRFFRPWAMEFFLELTQYQLPILCCEKIFDTLMNEDLWRIYSAVTGQSS